MNREFLANYKQSKTSKGFHKFLHSLPEGVSIIDDKTSKIKFLNNTIKQTFDSNLYYESSTSIPELQEFQHRLNDKFDSMMRGF